MDRSLVDGNNSLELNGCASLNTHTHHEFPYRIHAFDGKGANLVLEFSLTPPLINRFSMAYVFSLNIACKLTKCTFPILLFFVHTSPSLICLSVTAYC